MTIRISRGLLSSGGATCAGAVTVARRLKKIDSDIEIMVLKFIILANGWEVFCSEPDVDGDGERGFGLIYGSATELGYFSHSEIRPYIKAESEDLDVMPPPGWRWVSGPI